VYFDAQDPVYMIGKTVKQNILLGEQFIDTKYNKIKKILDFKSLDNLMNDEETIVLDKAVNLSSTERRNLLLARLMYLKGSIYIMDGFWDQNNESEERDLLVNLMQKCLKNKTVFYKSRSQSLIKEADKIILFFKDSIKVFNHNSDYIKHMKSREEDQIIGNEVEKVKGKLQRKISSFYGLKITDEAKFKNGWLLGGEAYERNHGRRNSLDSLSRMSESAQESVFINNTPRHGGVNKEGEMDQKKHYDMQWDDSSAYSRLHSSIWVYLKKKRVWFIILIYVFSFFMNSAIDFWVGAFSLGVFGLDFLLYILIIMGVWLFSMVFDYFRDQKAHSHLLKISTNVHEKMMDILFYLDVDWLNQNPSVRAWFKYSYDLRLIDDDMNHKLHHIFEYGVFLVGGMVMINIAYRGIFFIFTLFLSFILYKVLKRYVITSTKIIQFESKGKQEMFDLLIEAVEDEYKYRIMNKEIVLRDKFYNLSNKLERNDTDSLRAWIGVRLTLINTAISLLAYIIPSILTILFAKNGLTTEKPINILLLALSIMWTKKFIYYFVHFIDLLLDVFRISVAFGRIEHFLKNSKLIDGHHKTETLTQILTQELKWEKNREFTEKAIEIKSLETKLDNRTILNKFDLEITKGNKVGIIGKHGAGKHVFFDMLMKIHEFEDHPLTVFKVLGYDYKEVGGDFMRKKMSYLNKSPVTYSGTVRRNIDPEARETENDNKILLFLHQIGALGVLEKTVDDKKYFENNNNNNNKGFKQNNFVREPNFGASGNLHPKYAQQAGHLSNREKQMEIGLEGEEPVIHKLRKGLIPVFSTSLESRLTTAQFFKKLEHIPSHSIKRSKRPKPSSVGDLPIAREMTSLEREKLTTFLNTEFNSRMFEFPLKLRKLIKVAKLILDRPELILIDQVALEYGDLEVFEILQVLEFHLPDSTIFMIVDDYECLLEIDEVVVIEDGHVVETGDVDDLIMDKTSKLVEYTKNSNLNHLLKLQTEYEKKIDEKTEKDIFFEG